MEDWNSRFGPSHIVGWYVVNLTFQYNHISQNKVLGRFLDFVTITMRSLQFQVESLFDVITFLLQRLDPEEAKCFDKRIFTTINKHHLEIVQNIEATNIREAFKKKNDETYGKFHILGGGVSEGSFSICYHRRFKMHKKPF